ncbi:MAG: hypothetical protein WBN97_11485 [Parvibaculum sp.]
MPDKTKKLTLMQIAMLKAYSNGEFAYLAECNTEREALDCAATIKVRLSVNQDETRRRGSDEGRA